MAMVLEHTTVKVLTPKRQVIERMIKSHGFNSNELDGMTREEHFIISNKASFFNFKSSFETVAELDFEKGWEIALIKAPDDLSENKKQQLRELAKKISDTYGTEISIEWFAYQKK